MPKLVAAGIVVVVDIVRRPDDEAPQGASIVKKADEIDAATIVLCPHEQDFSEVTHPCTLPVDITPALFSCGQQPECADRACAPALGDGKLHWLPFKLQLEPRLADWHSVVASRARDCMRL